MKPYPERFMIGRFVLIPVLGMAVVLAAAQDSDQGVTRDEIILGSILDLSGPAAQYGKHTRQGMSMRIDEINEQGGILGRRIRLVVEDSAYDPRRAVLAAQKLVNRDRIFAMVGHMGAASNLAAFPILKERHVPNLFPGAASRSMFEPYDRLKYAYFPTYDAQLRGPVATLVRSKGISRACIHYQDDEFGQDVLRAGEDSLKALGLAFTEVTSYKRGAIDFSSQVARLKAARCQLVLLGTVSRETVGTMTDGRRIGFSPIYLATFAAYSEQIPALGGAAVEGLYATHVAQHPYVDDPAAPIRLWAARYRAKFGEDPIVQSVYGYEMIDIIFAAALRAGPHLGTESFIRALDSVSIPPSMFGTPAIAFREGRHLGHNSARLSQLRDGRWVAVSGYGNP